MNLIRPDELRDLLAYDATSGIFTWKRPLSNRVKKGSVAGSLQNQGYWTIRILGRAYQAHRVAWAYTFGVWPIGEIDHINGDKLDNRIVNLRDVPGRVNRQNIRAARCTSFSGVLGVRKRTDTGKWIARIVANRRVIHIGQFEDMESAKAAYLSAKRELHLGNTL
jgi:hypothetical protein